MADLDHLLPENRTAKCAVDMALYDLRGQALGRPVYQQLGGLRRPDGIRVTRAIGIHTLQETVRWPATGSSRATTPSSSRSAPTRPGDIERMRAVRDAIPPDVTMRIDANQGCSLPAALRVARALADAIEYFEQPISARDLAASATARSPRAITVDEAVHGMDDLLRVIDARAADNVVIKLIKCGGLRAAEHLAAVAAAAASTSSSSARSRSTSARRPPPPGPHPPALALRPRAVRLQRRAPRPPHHLHHPDRRRPHPPPPPPPPRRPPARTGPRNVAGSAALPDYSPSVRPELVEGTRKLSSGERSFGQAQDEREGACSARSRE